MADDARQSVQTRMQAAAWIVAAVTSVAFLLGYLWVYDFGNFALNNGVDWAHHMVMIDIIATGESWSAPEVIRRIGLYAVYPHSAHYLAAWLAALAGVSPLRTVHWVGNAAIIVSAAVVAGRLSLIAGGARYLSTAAITPVAGMLALYFFADWGIGFSGQLQWVFYYPQAVVTAFALILVIGLQRLARDDAPVAALFVAIALSAVLVVSFHPTPAVFVVAVGASCVFSRQGPFTWRVVQAGGAGLLAVGVMLMLPFFHKLLYLMDGTAGGDVNLESQRLNLSVEPMVLLIGLVILALLLAAALILLGNREVFRTHAGAVAVLACTTAAGIVLIRNHASEYYSVAKYVYLYCAEVSLLVASLVRVLMDRFTVKTPISRAQLAVFLIATVPLAMVAQRTYVTKYVTDQRPLIGFYAQAKAAEIRKVPRTLGYTERYYLAVSAFHENSAEAVEILHGKRED